jgi:hypothetical protein
VRQAAINFYLECDGGFLNRQPRPTPRADRLNLVNQLKTRGVTITASLMARSLAHSWHEYLGHEAVELTAAENKSFILKPRGYFGIKASAFGYELMLPDARNTRVMIPHNIGYTLMSLSRELSRRETKFREQPPDYTQFKGR